MVRITNKQNNDEIQNLFKSEVVELINFLEKFSKYDVLSHYYWEYKISLTQIDKKNEIWLITNKIMYLQILLSCIDDKKMQNKKIYNKDLNFISKKIQKIEQLLLQYRYLKEKDDKQTEEEYDYISHSEAFKNWNGKRYDIFEIQHHIDLLECLRDDFLNTYGFSLDELYEGINNLKNRFYKEFENSLNSLMRLRKRKKIFVSKRGKIDFPAGTTDKLKNKYKKYIENCFSIELANITKSTKWSKKYINQYTVQKETFKYFYNNITIENWNKLENEIKYKPIIKINGDYYLLLERRFYDNLDKMAIKGMREQLDKKKASELDVKYDKNIEIVVSDYFKNILKNGQFYSNNYYDYNQKILENDLLIVYKNFILIIEIKAGNFTNELAESNLESHKRSLENLIKKADEQQYSLEKCLLENGKVTIYDGNNKRKRNKKADITINNDTQIYKIIVTAESFNDIEARMDKIKIISLAGNAIVLCLDDLRVYSDYFKEHPYYFIEYLSQREKSIGNKNIDLEDELFHLGMWISYNDYSGFVNNRIYNMSLENDSTEIGFVKIIGDDWIEEIDRYYSNLYFKHETIEKPYRDIPAEIKRIINYLEYNYGCIHSEILAMILLYISDEALQTIDTIIKQSKDFYKKNKRAKYVYTGIESLNYECVDGLQIAAIYDDNELDEKSLIVDAYANMILSRCKKILCVFIYYNKNNQINNINIHILLDSDNIINSTKVLNTAELLRKKRGIKLLSDKIGRNQLCPCGSGRKYKHCCGKNK